jgi:predicted ArsR family transcriptional regulator
LISAVATRLGTMYASRLTQTPGMGSVNIGSLRTGLSGTKLHNAGNLKLQEQQLEQRMRSLSSVLTRQHIPAAVHLTRSKDSNLPVLDIGSCPYPTLRDDPGDRSLCKMEEEMLSVALGTPVRLTSCQLDGDHCCQFSPGAVGSSK